MELESILASESIVDDLDKKTLDDIARDVIDGYTADKNSRSEWEERNKEAMNLALQVSTDKKSPWDGASNVKFPAITIGAIQFNSRVYPAMITGDDVVKMRVIGPDPTGEKFERAARVSEHMSYQIMEEDEGWEEEFDKLLMSLPIMGCGFKKTYFDAELGHNISVNVLPKYLIIDYYARSLETAKRLTHELEYYKNELIEKQRAGVYAKFDFDDAPQHLHEDTDARQGIVPSETEAAHVILEQHTWLDLDDDGYEEPYIITVHKESLKVCRIVPRFTDEMITIRGTEIIKITPIHHFTKFTFIPAPDGGIYDLGFGSLLGPITESINTLINQLIDAGTRAVQQSGFIGRGARLKGGEYRIKGGVFKQINSTGDDLRKNIFLLPIKEPSQTLFQLLALLIEYAERISSVSDMMAGKTPGQNTPATTAIAALEQGQKVFAGIHKRIYRALREEFRKLYRLNQVYLNDEQYYQVVEGEDRKAYRKDYLGDPTDVRPSADPSMSSDQQRLANAQALKENAMTALSPYNGYEIEKRILEALNISESELVLPDPHGENAIPPPEDPKIEIEAAKFEMEGEVKSQEIQIKQMLASAQVGEIETRALLNLAKAEAAEDGIQMGHYQAQLDQIKEQREQMKVKLDADNQRAVQAMAGKSSNSKSS